MTLNLGSCCSFCARVSATTRVREVVMADIALKTSRDFVRDRKAAFLLWRLPALVMVAVAFLDIGPHATGTVWALCLSVFGFGCVSNAMR